MVKSERVYGERFETRDEIKSMFFEYIEMFYNLKRLDSTLFGLLECLLPKIKDNVL